MNNYERNKERVREMAVEWQLHFADTDHFMSKVVEETEKFYKLGKRYGLLTEFRENGIC